MPPDSSEAPRPVGAADAPSREEPPSRNEDGSAGESTQRKRSASDERLEGASAGDPPLPYDEEPPPLPEEAPPEDDGWTYQWDDNAGAYYFYNRLTGKSQWENPRISEAAPTSYGSYDRSDPTASAGAPGTSSPPKRKYGGYNPAIHGDYDPNADYAREAERQEEEEAAAAAAAAGLSDPVKQDYTTTAHFNRFTGKWQHAGMNPDYHNDENKSKRQMSAFFDVDAAANSHDGRSLKAERRGKTLSKKELKAFKDKRREKKEEKRRAWLRD